LIRCPACDLAVDAAATQCPACRADVKSGARAEPARPPAGSAGATFLSGLATVLALGLSTVVIGGGIGFWLDGWTGAAIGAGVGFVVGVALDVATIVRSG